MRFYQPVACACPSTRYKEGTLYYVSSTVLLGLKVLFWKKWVSGTHNIVKTLCWLHYRTDVFNFMNSCSCVKLVRRMLITLPRRSYSIIIQHWQTRSLVRTSITNQAQFHSMLTLRRPSLFGMTRSRTTTLKRKNFHSLRHATRQLTTNLNF